MSFRYRENNFKPQTPRLQPFTDFGDMVDLFTTKTTHDKPKQGFPFTNVYVNNSTNKLIFDIAVAGYDKDQIEISTEDQKLTVEYNVCDDLKDESNITYIEQSIAKRNFSKIWELSADIQTSSGLATHKNGILTIVFDLVKPSKNKINIK